MDTDRDLIPVKAKALQTIRRMLRDRMGPFGFQNIDIHPGRDYYGDPPLFIDAQYELSETPVDPKITYELLHDLCEALEAVGEYRFPHLRHHFHDRQKVAGFS